MTSGIKKAFPIKRTLIITLLALLSLVGGDYYRLHAKAKSDVDPYWMSLRDDKAYLRTGPSDSYPIKWIYQRKFMPVKVVGQQEVWYKIVDKDGDYGWMHAKLLSKMRAAIVIAEEPAALRDAPDQNARINWRAQPSVVGKISECKGNWCLFDVSGRMGYVERSMIWGDEPLAGQKNKE